MSQYWCVWLGLILLALLVFFAARHERLSDNKRRGYIVRNDLFGYPALDGRIFWTVRGAKRAQAKLSKQVPWCSFTVMRVV